LFSRLSIELASGDIIHLIRMIQVNCPALGRINQVITAGQRHVDTLLAAPLTPGAGEHDLGEQGGARVGVAEVSLRVTDGFRYWTPGNISGVSIVKTAWLADIVETTGVTVEALSLLRHGSCAHSGHISNIAVSISLALIGDGLTGVVLGVALVPGLTILIRVTSALVISLTHWAGIHTVIIGATTWATSKGLAVSTVETVVVVLIADSIKSSALRIINTLSLTLVVIIVTIVSSVTIIIRVAATEVRVLITDWGGVGTVDTTLMTTWAASVIGVTVSSAEEAVVMVSITHLIKTLALIVVITVRHTEASVGVAPVLSIAVTVLAAATGVGLLVTHWSWVGTVESTVMTPFTAAIVTAALSSTEEAVVMLSIAGHVEPVTEWVIITHSQLTLVTAQVTLVVLRTVAIVQETSTPGLALHGTGVTVVAMASVGVAGVGHVADSVKHGALRVVSAPAHVVTAAGWVRVRTVDTVSSNNRASSNTFSSITEGTGRLIMRSGNIADSIKVVTVRVLLTLTHSVIDTVEVESTVTIRTLVTVIIVTTLVHLWITDHATLYV